MIFPVGRGQHGTRLADRSVLPQARLSPMKVRVSSVSRLATFGKNVWLIVADTLSFLPVHPIHQGDHVGYRRAHWTEYA